ncbi:hypothetical protein D3C71_984190 [compost metagenome]
MHFREVLGSDLQLTLVPHLRGDGFGYSILRGVVEGVDQPSDTRRHKVLFLVGFQHIQCLFVGEACMENQFKALLHTGFDGLIGARVSRDPLACKLGFGREHGYFLLRKWIRFGRDARDVFPREIDLEMVNTILYEHSDDATHVFGSAANGAKVHCLVG